MDRHGLTLVTGPANSAKAQVVLDAHRAALARSPILVVPRAADVEHYRRELADGGRVLGVRVEPFGGTDARDRAARRSDSATARRACAQRSARVGRLSAAKLDAARRAAQAPAFIDSLARFIAQLAGSPHRARPLRRCATCLGGAGHRPARYAEELAGLYSGYQRQLERLDRLDAEQHALRSLDALRAGPRPLGQHARVLPTASTTSTRSSATRSRRSRTRSTRR
jgi:hypothetical protein